MDRKEHEILNHFYHKISNNSIDEKDILGLMILIRQYAPKNSSIREFGDFIAHRKKDRGHFLEFIDKHKKLASNVLNPNKEKFSKKEAELLLKTLPVVYTEEETHDCINSILNKFGFASLSKNETNIISLCMISLLQEVTFEDNNGNDIGNMLIVFNKEVVILFCSSLINEGKDPLLIPMLRISNNHINYNSTDDSQFASTPNNFITIENENRKIKIRST